MTAKAQGETKYIDGYLDNVAVHELSITADDNWADTELNPRQQTAVYGCMPIPRQGTNYGDRDGRKIYLKTLRIKGYINWPGLSASAVVNNATAVRIIVVKDTKTNGTACDAENVIGAGLGSDGQATLSGDGGAINFLSNPDGWSRYKILYDKIFRPPVNSASAAVTQSNQNAIGMQVPIKIKLKINCWQNYSDTTGAVGSVIDNSIHLFAAATTTSFNPTLCYYARQAFVG
jgi:hypothetical protein